ncbi:MAG: hypothetical protein U0230_01270 [Polyangiales bacterium]
MRIARAILFSEALVNLGTAACAGLFPALFVAQFARGAAVPPGLAELGRWYGVLVFFVGAFLLHALRDGRPVLVRPLLSFLLAGDLVQIAATIATIRVFGEIELLTGGSLGMSLIYAGARIAILRDASMIPESRDK